MLEGPIESRQYTSVKFGEKLSLSGIRPSVGSVGDAFDNAQAETTIGLYKNECVRADSPFRRGPLNTVGDVEYITADYVAWYNQDRLMHRLGRIPPAEAEARYCSQLVTGRPVGSQNPEVHETRDGSKSETAVRTDLNQVGFEGQFSVVSRWRDIRIPGLSRADALRGR